MKDRKEYDKKYRLIHRQELKERSKKYHETEKAKQLARQYYLKHQEFIKEYEKQYYLEHKNEIKKRKKEYRLMYSEQECKRVLKYYENNKKFWIKRIRQYQKAHPEKIREIYSRHVNKRNRNLDFVPLNKPFKGSEAHHLDKTYVIYIPKEVHQSIPHSVLKNRNMDEINALAFNYLNNDFNITNSSTGR